MKILLIGKNGQVGWELNRTLLPLGEVVAIDYPEIDLSEGRDIEKWLIDVKPDIVINAAAYTGVENAELEKDQAFAVNGKAPGMLAEMAKSIGAAFIHYSTDYVFDGEKGEPYLESDQANPINVYGRSKLAGERAIQKVDGEYLIFRTSWVYSMRRPCFVTKSLSWARKHKELRIVDDQIASPTWCRMLAQITAQIVSMGIQNNWESIKENKGIYHIAGKGSVSRFEWVKLVLENDPNPDEHVFKKLSRAKSSEFNTKAERPSFSAMNCKKVENVFGVHVPPWAVQIPLALAESNVLGMIEL